MASTAEEGPRPAALWRAYPLGPDADKARTRVSQPVASAPLGAVPGYRGGPDNASDGRLMVQLGILLAVLYVGFLTVWFSTVRRPAPLGPRRGWRQAGHRVRPQPRAVHARGPWTCEIAWRRCRFQAVMTSPDGRSQRVVVESQHVPWPPGDVRRPPTRELETALGSVVASMVAAGWEPVESGGAWSERRFVWVGEDEPPARVEPRGSGAAGMQARHIRA